MAITPDTEQLLPVLQRYGFETLEKLLIGSSETLTSPVFKKLFNRLFFAQNAIKAVVFPAGFLHGDYPGY
jgi:hypothetical protein